ncbi:MAG: HAMP domain-containing histidine kinase [Candidatus Heimdallarchaeota archaeon]|nr:HAMP domain-containing histidine kinase [Candidatus Heimdallarchaeota archaeon]
MQTIIDTARLNFKHAIYEDVGLTRKSILLSKITTFAMIVTSIGVTLRIAIAQDYIAIPSFIVLNTFLILAKILNNRRKHDLAYAMLIYGFYLIALVGSTVSGGVQSEYLNLLFLYLILTQLFFDFRMLIINGFLALISVFIIYIVESKGYIIGFHPNPLQSMMVKFVVLSLIIYFLYINYLSNKQAEEEALSLQINNVLRKMDENTKMENLGKRAINIAHDFNNLLSVISLYNDLVMHNISDQPEIEQDAKQISIVTDKAKLLIQQLLDFGKPESDIPISICINDIINENLASYHSLVVDRELILNLEPSLAKANVSPFLLDQICVNLLVNAVEASEKETKILLQTSMLDGYVTLSVKDFGSGIPRSIREHIFKPYITSKNGGHGIGLYTIFNSLKKIGGKIEFSTETNKGTVFTVFLPMA